MVAFLVFVLHGVAAIYAFVTRKRQDGISEGILAVAFLAIIFSVGWTILTMLARLIYEPAGLAGWFNRDAITLVLLTVCETVFYYFFLGLKRKGKRNLEGPGSST